MRRVEIFSDGVFAIAATLLVLELPFEQVAHGELSDALADHWPSFVTFVISFMTIGIAWLHHGAVFDALARVDRLVLILNLLFLMGVAFLPFPTALLADYLEQEDDVVTAGVVYSGTWLYVALSLGLLITYAARRQLLRRELGDDAIRRLLRQQWTITIAYALFTGLATVAPRVTLGLYGLAAAFVLVRGDYAILGEDPGADIVPPR